MKKDNKEGVDDTSKKTKNQEDAIAPVQKSTAKQTHAVKKKPPSKNIPSTITKPNESKEPTLSDLMNAVTTMNKKVDHMWEERRGN